MTWTRHHRFGLVALGAGVAALGIWGYAESARRGIHELAEVMPVSTRFVRLPVREPSGVAYHPGRGTLLVVSDAGEIVEMDLRYNVLRRFDLPGDLEGIAVHPATGTVFVTSERDAAILEYDLNEQRVLRTLLIDLPSHPDFAAGSRGNKGLEGVTVVATADEKYRLFAVVEAKPARMIALSADVSAEATRRARSAVAADASVRVSESVSITASVDVGLRRISDVLFDAASGVLFMTSAGTRVLTLTNLEGTALRAIRLPGRKPEGFCFIPSGDAIVVQDTGGLWVCKNLRQALFPDRQPKLQP